MMAVVDRPGTKGIVRTVPPRARTASAPAIAFLFQSPPLTSTSGAISSTRAAGVSSPKGIT